MKWINQYTGFLRQLRFIYWLNNYKHRHQLIKNKALYKKFGIKRSVLKSIDSRILSKYIGDVSKFNPPSFQKKATAKKLEDFPLEIQQAFSKWEENGFLLLQGFISQDEVNEIDQEIDKGLKDGTLHYNYTHRKIFNAHKQINAIQKVAKHQLLLDILEYIFGRPAIHFQTINFNKSSEQAAHSDFIHMTTLPLGFLAGAWIALEEINDDNGPLTYYPGSHKLPYVLNHDYGNSSNAFLLDGNANIKYEKKVAQVAKEAGLNEMKLKANAGDILIWHANLLHGAAPIKNPDLTRKSMVFHYFAKDVLCFHEISERPAII